MTTISGAERGGTGTQVDRGEEAGELRAGTPRAGALREAARRGAARRRVAKAARWLHVYLSMVSFTVVLFFAVTGLTLNHPGWFAGAVRTRLLRGAVDARLVADAEASKAALVAAVRAKEHLQGAVDEVRVEAEEVSFSYRGPGYSADVTVERPSGRYAVTEVRNGAVAVLNDLHKGRDAGRVWGWVIDGSAVLLTLVSLTGLLLLWFVYNRRASGLVVAGVGAAVAVLLWRVWVP